MKYSGVRCKSIRGEVNGNGKSIQIYMEYIKSMMIIQLKSFIYDRRSLLNA